MKPLALLFAAVAFLGVFYAGSSISGTVPTLAEQPEKQDNPYVKDFVEKFRGKWKLIAPAPLPFDGQEVAMEFRDRDPNNLQMDFRRTLSLDKNVTKIKGILKWVVLTKVDEEVINAGGKIRIANGVSRTYHKVKPFFQGNMLESVGLLATTLLDKSTHQIVNLDLGNKLDEQTETLFNWVNRGEDTRSVYLMRLVFVMKEPKKATFLIAGPIKILPNQTQEIIYQKMEVPTVRMFVVEFVRTKE